MYAWINVELFLCKVLDLFDCLLGFWEQIVPTKFLHCNSEFFKVDPIILLTWHHVFKKVGNTAPQASVVQRLDIHRINLYPVDSAIIGFPNTYPLDSGLSGG